MHNSCIHLHFLSYGVSSTIAAFASVGLVVNVLMRRFS
jgi:cell division protein FtsW (lipid II flippase)